MYLFCDESSDYCIIFMGVITVCKTPSLSRRVSPKPLCMPVYMHTPTTLYTTYIPRAQYLGQEV